MSEHLCQCVRRPVDVLAYIERHLDDREFVWVPFAFHEGRSAHIAKIERPTDLRRDEVDRLKALLDAWVVA